MPGRPPDDALPVTAFAQQGAACRFWGVVDERRRLGCRRLFLLVQSRGEASSINHSYWRHRKRWVAVRKGKPHRKDFGTRVPLLIDERANKGWLLGRQHGQFARR